MIMRNRDVGRTKQKVESELERLRHLEKQTYFEISDLNERLICLSDSLKAARDFKLEIEKAIEYHERLLTNVTICPSVRGPISASGSKLLSLRGSSSKQSKPRKVKPTLSPDQLAEKLLNDPELLAAARKMVSTGGGK